MDRRPWVDKHRPSSLGDVKGHEDILRFIKTFVLNSEEKTIVSMPHLLLHGPPGTGKTSTILALARDTYGNKFRTMVLELNASDDRGSNAVKDTILPFVKTSSLDGDGIKLVILDEADAMTIEAQTLLRRIMEKYTETVRFCICCNYSSKIIPSLHSRCVRFRFPKMSRQSLEEKLIDVVEKEGLDIEIGAVEALIDMSDGDTRKVINLLQSSTMSARSEGRITREDVYDMTGFPTPEEIRSIVDTLTAQSFTESCKFMESMLVEKGYTLVDIVHLLGESLQGREYEADTRVPGILEELADVELRLSHGGSDILNIGPVVSSFHH